MRTHLPIQLLTKHTFNRYECMLEVQAGAKRKLVKMDDSDEDAVIDLGGDSDSDDGDFEIVVSDDDVPSPVRAKSSKPSASSVKRHVGDPT